MTMFHGCQSLEVQRELCMSMLMHVYVCLQSKKCQLFSFEAGTIVNPAIIILLLAPASTLAWKCPTSKRFPLSVLYKEAAEKKNCKITPADPVGMLPLCLPPIKHHSANDSSVMGPIQGHWQQYVIRCNQEMLVFNNLAAAAAAGATC